MIYKRLFIWVEGYSDARFFKHIIKPILERKYHVVHVRQYSQEKNESISKIIGSIKEDEHDYWFIADLKGKPCVTARKNTTLHDYHNSGFDRIIVVIKEIEGWYLAGLTAENAKKLGLPNLENTEHITKKKFKKYRCKRYISNILCMLNILEVYSIKKAIEKNKSFKYFLDKIKLE